MHFIQLLEVKYIVTCVMEENKIWMPWFLCQPLLLSTTIINDLLVYSSALVIKALKSSIIKYDS